MIKKTVYAGFLLSSMVTQAEEAKKNEIKVQVQSNQVQVKEDKAKAQVKDDKARAQDKVTIPSEVAKKDSKKTQKKKGVLKLELGQVAPTLLADKKKMSSVSENKAWSSKDLEGKLSILFYVAPSKKDLNSHVTDAISASVEAGKISRENYSSFAVINMAASGWPNWLIAMKLSGSQKKFPNTTYVKDYKGVLVETWGLKDKSNDVVMLDSKGTVLFRFDGKLPDDEVKKLVNMLEEKAGPKKKIALKTPSAVASKKASAVKVSKVEKTPKQA